MSAPALQPFSEPKLHYDRHFRQEVVLRDGRVAHLFLLGAEHAALLQRGFARLSLQSRYRRFMSSLTRLSDAQLRYLTDTDGFRHVALAAGVEGLPGQPTRCIEAGVARFVQLRDEPSVVEGAVTVVDEFQGLGLGSLLMEHLVRAAIERGYLTLQAELLLENRPAMRLLHKLGSSLSLRRDGSTAIVRIDLSEVPSERLAPQTR